MSETVNFTNLETEEKLNCLYHEMKTIAFKQNQILGDLEYMGKQLRQIEIIQEDSIGSSLNSMVSAIADISKKIDRLTAMETVLNTIKSDVKIIKEL